MSKFVMLDTHSLPEADFHQEKEILSKNGIDCVLAKCTNDDEVVQIAKDAECIGVCYTKITEALLARLPNLKLVVRYGIGYDVVDVKACSQRKIAVCNLPTYCIEDVATHAMALLLDAVRKVSMYDRAIRQGNWDVALGYSNHRLSAMTLGLVGFGRISRKVASYAKAFGMDLLVYDPFFKDPATLEKYQARQVDLKTLLSHSDAISLHCPCTEETKHLINEQSLTLLKPGAIIINTSRGALISNDALVKGLTSGQIIAAGLDVSEDEPIRDPAHQLLGFDSVTVTPHSAYNSVEASDEQHRQVAETVVKFTTGEIPFNTVNKDFLI